MPIEEIEKYIKFFNFNLSFFIENPSPIFLGFKYNKSIGKIKNTFKILIATERPKKTPERIIGQVFFSLLYEKIRYIEVNIKNNAMACVFGYVVTDKKMALKQSINAAEILINLSFVIVFEIKYNKTIDNPVVKNVAKKYDVSADVVPVIKFSHQ